MPISTEGSGIKVMIWNVLYRLVHKEQILFRLLLKDDLSYLLLTSVLINHLFNAV